MDNSDMCGPASLILLGAVHITVTMNTPYPEKKIRRLHTAPAALSGACRKGKPTRSPKLHVVDNVKALATKGRHAQSANFSLPRLEETTDDPSFAELMWWLAMVALNRAWELHDQLRAVAKINTQVVEEGKREEQAEEEAVKENVVEENAVAEEEEDNVEEEPPVGMYEAEYRCIVGRFAKKLPALAAGGVQMAADPRKAVDLRAGLLKQRMARRVMLHGIDHMEKEVTQDRDSDPRASLALADMWHVKELFDETKPGEHVPIGSPQWKRLCRIMGFLRRNV